MAHLAFVCVPASGHITPMAALAQELVRRGHTATFLHHPDVGPLIRRLDLDFRPVGGTRIPEGTLDESLRRAGRVKGVFGLRPLVRDLARGTAMLCEELPAALRALSVDMIVGDWIEPAAGLVAHHLGLPYVSLAAALPLNWEKGIPSPFLGWSYGHTQWHRWRDRAVHYVGVSLQGPVQDVIRDHAERWRLGPLWQVEHCASGFAQLAQLTPSLDYPRKKLIGCFHYCGPIRGTPVLAAPSRKSGSRRAFASLGSLQGHRADLFERIADAAELAGFELTIAHGGRMDAAAAARLSRRATVHEFVSYETIFAETDIAVMHGGMNGVLDALAHGLPLVVVPVAFEQGAIAARVRHAGAGLMCRPQTSRRRLADAMWEVFENPSFATAAAAIGSEIRDAGGVAQAADIVEQVARTGQPCLNATAIRADPSLSGYALQPRRREAEPRSV